MALCTLRQGSDEFLADDTLPLPFQLALRSASAKQRFGKVLIALSTLHEHLFLYTYIHTHTLSLSIHISTQSIHIYIYIYICTVSYVKYLSLTLQQKNVYERDFGHTVFLLPRSSIFCLYACTNQSPVLFDPKQEQPPPVLQPPHHDDPQDHR